MGTCLGLLAIQGVSCPLTRYNSQNLSFEAIEGLNRIKLFAGDSRHSESTSETIRHVAVYWVNKSD